MSRLTTDQMPPIRTPRVKILGGSSAVNATVALRARAADFIKWGEQGAEVPSTTTNVTVIMLAERIDQRVYVI